MEWKKVEIKKRLRFSRYGEKGMKWDYGEDFYWNRGYWHTDTQGDGIFFCDLNEDRQIVSMFDFSIAYNKDPKAKIRRWMEK